MAIIEATTTRKYFKFHGSEWWIKQNIKQWEEYVLSNKIGWVRWFIKEIKVYEQENDKWEKYERFDVVFVDNEWEFELQGGYNNIARNIINCLAWITTPTINKEVTISVYPQWDFAAVSVKYDWQRATWKYSIDEQKSMIPVVKVSWKDMRDYSKYDAILKDAVSKFVFEYPQPKQEQPKQEQKDDINIEDVPF